MSYYEAWQVEIVGREIIYCPDFETALATLLRERDYDVQVKLIFTGGEWEEE